MGEKNGTYRGRREDKRKSEKAKEGGKRVATKSEKTKLGPTKTRGGSEETGAIKTR